jgi:C-terminal processing protease CtpA/Prc
VVTHLNPGFEHPTFKIGVEVLYWNGVPIKRAVEINGESQAGSNLEARFAAGLSALTIRAMIGSLPPDENWVVITYRSLDGRELEYKQDWLIFTPEPEGAAIDTSSGAKLGIDLQRAVVNQVRKILFAPEAVTAEKKVGRTKTQRIALGNSIETSLPSVLRAQPVTTPKGTFAYIRIFNFEADNSDEFVKEFIRLMELLPQNGLIIDVRGNGGGYIENGERLLQLLTPNRIEPELFEFLNSPLNLEICRVGSKSEGLEMWAASIAQSVMTGATYSLGFALTSRQLCNEIGQRYYGPVLLIIDALCYSTTDMFTAGFQDHEVGDILGVNGNTGAGGANVWDHEYLVTLFKNRTDSPFKRLPKNAGIRVAIRRSMRTGGTPLEELGVIPNERHYMTKADLLSGNVDLINHAGEMLSKKPARKISVEIKANLDQTKTIVATTEHIARLDLYVNDRPQQSLHVVSGTTQFNKTTLPKGARLLLEGFDRKNNLVAAHRKTVY